MMQSILGSSVEAIGVHRCRKRSRFEMDPRNDVRVTLLGDDTAHSDTRYLLFHSGFEVVPQWLSAFPAG